MISGERKGRSRHKPRHSGRLFPLSSLGILSLADLPKLSEDPISVLMQWGIYESDLKTLMKRLDKIWQRLSLEQRWLLIRTAESVAAAEMAKHSWNLKEQGDRYKRLAHNAVDAAKLAEELSICFPPPWDNEHGSIGLLVAQLNSFVSSALHATFADKYVSARVASMMLRRFKRSVAKQIEGMPWQLIRGLAWLASGKKRLCGKNSEKTLRRYFESPSPRPRSPADAYWRSNWNLIVRLARIAPKSQGDALEKVFERYLKSRP